MNRWKTFLLSSFAVALVTVGALVLSQTAAAAPLPAPQISVGVGIGVEPICPYGYFDYAPYDCAPYGYYGPDWFNGGVFIGAGPWFHGPHGFYGHVDNRYDPRNGYRGPLPNRGSGAFNNFHANEARDGQGHTGTANHDGGGEHSAGFARRGGGGGGRRR